jgi:hypothetical protein
VVDFGQKLDGNTGCQRDNSCNYGKQTCCYNTWGDHKCYIYDGLPELDIGDYGQTNIGDYEEKITPECKIELTKSGSSRNIATLAVTISAAAASLMAYA